MFKIKQILLFVLLVLLVFQLTGGFAAKKISTKNEKQVRQVLQNQTEAWNEGNLEKFMETYLKSEELVFVGKKGPAFGWNMTLEKYKKGYPDKDTMGKLSFDILSINRLSRNLVFLIGRYHLERKMGNANGNFSLVMQKLHGKWLIISDHSSSSD